MTDYKVYRFDGAGHSPMAEWIEATDDQDAVRQTHQLGEHSELCELWRGNHLIATVRQRLSE